MSKFDFTTFANIIGGGPRQGTESTHAINPSTGKPNWKIPVATPSDLDEAVSAAQSAFPAWANTPWTERAEKVQLIDDVLTACDEEMVTLLMEEAGKPVRIQG